MGATTGTVDEVKFGKELKIVFDKVSAMAPDIIVSSTLDGELIYVSCVHMNHSGRILCLHESIRTPIAVLLVRISIKPSPLFFYSIFSFIVGTSVSAQLSVDQRETTELVLEIVQVAENNGLKLPREFGLLLKQVGI